MVDLIGINSVASIIEQSGLSKFQIFKIGVGANSMPVFECLTGENHRQAKANFVNWANSVLMGNPRNSTAYELQLFDVEDEAVQEVIEVEETSKDRPKKTKKKSNKIKLTFSLSGDQFGMPVLNGNEGRGEQVTKEDIARMIGESLKKQEEDRANNEILKRLVDLENRLTEEEEEGEEEDELSGIEDTITKVTGMIDKIQGKKSEPVAVSGLGEDQSNTRKENIKRAITILLKHDNQLDTDLLKLSEVAEKSPTQFQFLLSALRKM